jgi:hypothetical protein
MIQLTSKGDWKKTRGWLKKVTQHDRTREILAKYGKLGVIALKNNTPSLTGTTAESWYYDIERDKNGVYKLIWGNSNLAEEWFNVALFLQLGHATADGHWIEGVDYINPALAPIFDKIAREAWDEVNNNNI